MRGEAEAASRALATTIDTAKEALNREAISARVRDFLSGDTASPEAVQFMNEHFSRLVRGNHLFSRMLLADSSGRVLTTGPSGQVGSGWPANSDYFRKALSGTVAVTDAYMSQEMGAATVTIAQPVNLNGKLAGVILVNLNLDAVYKEIIAPIKMGSSGYGYVVESPGVVALHKDKNLLFNERLAIAGDLRDMISQGDGNLTGKGLDNVERIAVYRKVPGTSMVVVVQQHISDLLSGLGAIRNAALGIMLGAVVIGFVVVYFLLRFVIRSLQKALVFAQEIATGNLDGDLAIRSKDETGKLADALREIPKTLKAVLGTYKSLEEEVEKGNLKARGDVKAFSGAFSTLVADTNAIMDRFDMVLNSIPSPVVILDRNLRASHLNSAATAIAGVDYAGKTCEEMFGREDYNTSACALRRSVETLRAASGETVAHPRGKTLEVAYTSIPMLDKQGKLAAVLQLITDLTEIKKTQHTIVEVAAEAMDISNRVAAASEQLSAQVEQVSRGADVQRDRIIVTASSMEQMNATVMEVAKSAGQASQQAEGTRSKAKEGVELVEKVIAGISQVNTVAQELHANMQSLGEQAEAIGGVMNVISDIADQTNLLALNAAIEAARAGEAGRGFAVVADEVRKLAEKTMNATTQVGSSIKGIQSATTTNIERVSEAAKGVGNATQLAGTSGAALNEILSMAGTNSSLIAGIATAAEEQSTTSDEISKAVDEVNRIAGETAAGMGQASTAVQEVAAMSQQLRVLLGKLQAA
jgi:methyl-accepting chemotaxis protein